IIGTKSTCTQTAVQAGFFSSHIFMHSPPVGLTNMDLIAPTEFISTILFNNLLRLLMLSASRIKKKSWFPKMW
ncbi:MAG: hypothetical protein M0Q43_09705, partial [Methanothrix sp.]|nr:hypothetical protein [Methanothrix sp.]